MSAQSIDLRDPRNKAKLGFLMMPVTSSYAQAVKYSLLIASANKHLKSALRGCAGLSKKYKARL